MGPKKSRKNVKKIEVPTDTPIELELGETAADIQRRRRKAIEQMEREDAEKQQRKERDREEARKAETPQSQAEEAVAEKDQELRGVKKVKWTRRVEERSVHINRNAGARMDI